MDLYSVRGGTSAFLVGLVLVSAFSSCNVIQDLTTRALPLHEGTLKVEGLTAPVEILRDKWGVPHIYAKNAHDLFFAQGYTHAQDRWWQMEFFRHVGRGALSEMLGEQTLADDIYLRTLRLYDTAEQEVDALEPDARAASQAFADGINAYILSREPEALAMEYAALKLNGTTVQIAPWTIADSLVFGKIIQLQQGLPMNDEAVFEEALNTVGEERLAYWAPPLPYGVKPTILQASDFPFLKAAGQIGARPGSMLDQILAAPLGSNSWTVSASLTTTGRPILENDPHLAVNTPSLYYEIALHSEGGPEEAPIDVAGVAFPPFLGVGIGHNADIAWGITIGKGVDAWDTYHIRVNPERPTEQYEWNGQWVDFTVRQETFGVAGVAPVTIPVRETIWGPIINDTIVRDASGVHMVQSDEPLALCWVGLEPGGIGTALYRLAIAQDWNGFHEALSFWNAPAFNFSYADTGGNIGYQLAGTAPIRAFDHSGLIPMPGWTDEYAWKGFVHYNNLPHVVNPERGMIVHANQAVAPPEYFEWLSGRYGGSYNVNFQPTAFYGYRAERLDQLLAGQAPYGVQDFTQVQADVRLTSVDEVVPYLAALVIDDESPAQLREELLQWDREFRTDSKEATLYWLFWTRLLDNIYSDETPSPQPNDGAMYAVSLLLDEPDNAWWDDVTTPDVVETRDSILLRSLAEAGNERYERYGKCTKCQEWGRCHTIKFTNLPIGASGIGLIEAMVNRGPYAIPGTTETVNVAEGVDDGKVFEVKWAPCMRVVFDVGEWGNSLINLAPGQSGHPFSRNYSDQIRPWLKVEHRRMPWTRGQVEQVACKRLVLEP